LKACKICRNCTDDDLDLLKSRSRIVTALRAATRHCAAAGGQRFRYSLTTEDFERILTEPSASLTEQYKALMGTEGVNIEFTADGIRRIAEAAWQVNESTENIGARRLHTVLERLMEDISYDASEINGQSITIDADYVRSHLDELVADEDLSRFIL
ncbi:hypothetical protein ACQKG5_24855, partial [Serratia bockelmannii]